MATSASTANTPSNRVQKFLSDNGPGFAVSVVIAAAAQFLSEHYGVPAMLMALLLGRRKRRGANRVHHQRDR